MTIEFKEWPKTSRFFRDIVITEKIDGTNAAVGIVKLGAEDLDVNSDVIDKKLIAPTEHNGELYGIYAQSRSKIITPGKSTDNYGFAGWVSEHAYELVHLLGEGLHFGEWWGSGIQRGYGLHKGEKRFSLFNVNRFSNIEEESDNLLHVVPVLYEGTLNVTEIQGALVHLENYGSEAAPGFMDPEGICIYHSSSRIVQKVTLDANDMGKWEYAA